MEVSLRKFEEHEQFIQEILHKIPAVADHLRLTEPTRGKPESERTSWTRAVKSVLFEKRKGHVEADFYGTHAHEEKKYHEWLLDAVLYLENRGVWVAVESEFEQNEKGREYDFRKLLSIKAPLKIFVIDSAKKPSTDSLRALELIASRFQQHLPSEVYYVLDYHRGRVDVYREIVPDTILDGHWNHFRFAAVESLSGPTVV